MKILNLEDACEYSKVCQNCDIGPQIISLQNTGLDKGIGGCWPNPQMVQS